MRVWRRRRGRWLMVEGRVRGHGSAMRVVFASLLHLNYETRESILCTISCTAERGGGWGQAQMEQGRPRLDLRR